VKRFVCKKLPRKSVVCPGGGAELYGNVEYEWIFHHQPELKIFKNGQSFKTVLLAPLDEAALHRLWSEYFPRLGSGRRLSSAATVAGSALNTTGGEI